MEDAYVVSMLATSLLLPRSYLVSSLQATSSSLYVRLLIVVYYVINSWISLEIMCELRNSMYSISVHTPCSIPKGHSS
ncbi:hypothetical protein EYC80_005251 [Monilinia laxa]|uniref:Uncharacterized protein n=1 Tax=Monilinia laxa TaxID=61186 RepID=A0A5N6KJM7_MONLA|nr:hypothetical protein EYC80_005251 [Monilinia laxa]